MSRRKKLIEVALPLVAINEAAAREKAIRHGHPSTIHLWWARRPLAAARAVLFSQLVDDPSSWPEVFPTEASQETERKRLFDVLERLVRWENSDDPQTIAAARLEIARSHARASKSAAAAALQSGEPNAEQVDRYLAGNMPPVHDPFAGGGTIPLEAQRLGLRPVATDLNPVAALINKGLVEAPARFANRPPVNPTAGSTSALNTWRGAKGLAEDVRHYGAEMRNIAKERVGRFYPDIRVSPALASARPQLAPYVGKSLTVVAWLWARTVASPNPATKGVHVPLVSSFWLSTKEARQAWIEPVIDKKHSTYRFEVRTGVCPNPKQVDCGTRAGKAQDFVCLLSGTPIPREYVRDEGKAGRLGTRLLATVALAGSKGGRIYLEPDDASEALARSADVEPVVEDSREGFLNSATPSRAMITGGVCSAYGLSTWGHLFTGRQLVALTALSDAAKEIIGRVMAAAKSQGMSLEDAKAYGGAIGLYLSFAISRSVDRGSVLCSWDSSPKMEALRNTFARQALPMVWDFAEGNPFSESSGNIEGNVEWVANVLDKLVPGPVGIVGLADAVTSPLTEGAVVSTDPPYFDNIGYAELSDFFYPWLRRTLAATYQDLFGTMFVPKKGELVATRHQHGGREAANTFFLDGMTKALENMHRAADSSYPIAVYYAFKQSETEESGTSSTGWETFLSAVVGAGFSISGTWPMRTELGNRMVGHGTNALASSVVLVCRKRDATAAVVTRRDFQRELRSELPHALRALKHSNIAPVDLAQATIGPGMAIFSRHQKVVEADGSPMSVRSALQIINEALDESLSEQEGEADPMTRFAVTWFESNGWAAGPFGDAETLAKARNISVSGAAEAGILHSAAGKVRLMQRSELPDGWRPSERTPPTIWEATQHLIKKLERDGEREAATLLADLGDAGAQARELAYRLFTTCERRTWTEDARSYNGLVFAWPELERLAAHPRPPQEEKGQIGLELTSPSDERPRRSERRKGDRRGAK